jgi:hypothetical protein
MFPPTTSDMPRPDAPERDAAGAMPDDMRHALPLDKVGNIYASRGFPRSRRSLQRFCAGGGVRVMKSMSLMTPALDVRCKPVNTRIKVATGPAACGDAVIA